MSLNRREFMTMTAGMSAAWPLSSGLFAAQGQQNRYRACVIGDTGHGDYGHNLHLMWGLRDDVEVVGLADPDETGRKEHGKQAKAQRLYADYHEMLQQEKPDLVAIGPRWTIHHKEYLMACAEVGAHGIIEKPLGVDLAEMDEIIATMDQKKLKWAVAFNFRSAPAVQHARKAIFEDKVIGQVLEMRARGKEDPRSGGEDLIVLGIHLFDLMIFLAGEPEWGWANVSTDGHRSVKEDVREATEPLGPIIGDTIQAVYGFPNGIIGHFSTVKNQDGNQGRWGLDVMGTKGIVTFRMAAAPAVYMLPDPTWAPGGRPATWQTLPGTPEAALEGPVAHYKPIIDDLITSIEQDKDPDYGLRAARAAHEMVQCVFASARQPDCRLALPLQERKHPLTASE
ncbi:MAG: Gfo/Idh/MocA family oxidoreductase [Candidatus Hydrogenedentes bacterium]|nr:Gfo/Idh/MocA family oxidoreductase [Candidatus Hydrogenedentota bacterium]